MRNFWLWLKSLFATPTPVIVNTPPVVVPAPVVPSKDMSIAPVLPTKYPFDSPANALHSTRVIGDEVGLTWQQKAILCSCIDVESEFYNYLPSGKPTIHENRNAAGAILSTDWGICQINDYWHIGPRKDFASVDLVMKNPATVVRYMAKILRDTGKLQPWVSYTSGAYLDHMHKYL